jgi:uncharacterized protein YkwD
MVLKTAAIMSAGMILLSGCGSHRYAGYSANKIKTVPYKAPRIDAATKQSYLEAVNRMRSQPRQCGRKFYAAARPLEWKDTLYRASYEHSKDMADCSHFSHNGSKTQSDWTAQTQNLGRCSSFVNRIENNGYLRYKGIAENIAYGAKSADEVMQQWIASEGHCVNIMNPKFTEFGMAKVVAPDGRHYWTQNFGNR